MFISDTMEYLPTSATKLRVFYNEAYGEIVKVSGEYLVTLTVDKMWKYRKRWKFRYPSTIGHILFNFILVSRHKQHKGKIKSGKWNIPTFTMEKCFIARWHLPTFSPYLPDVFMQKRRGIISMITFSWNRRGLAINREVQERLKDFSVHAVERQANEAAHWIARRFRFLSCLITYVVSPFFIALCIYVFCIDLALMIGLFSRLGDGKAVTQS